MAKLTSLNFENGRRSERQRAQRPETHIDLDAPLGTIGQELRGARISKGEDLATISRILKIRKEHLDALEQDNLSALPGRTYAVGFIRAYADYLGLHPANTVERFKTEIAGRDEVSPTAGFKELEEEPGLSRGWIFIAFIVFALIAYGAYYLFMSAGSQNRQPVAAVPAQMIEKPAKSKPRRTASAQPGLSAPGSSISQTAANSPATLAAPAPEHAAVRPGPGGQLFGKWNANPRIVLQIKQPTHILVQDEDGKTYINRILQPGDIYQVANHTGLSLTAEHGNAIVVNIDGRAAGTLGNSADAVAAMPLDFDKVAAQHPVGATQQ